MPQARNKALGVGGVSFAIGLGLFLLVSPAVEREAHLATLRDPAHADVEHAVRKLCWTRPGREGLDQTLPEIEIAHRVQILAAIAAEGCLDELDVQMRVTHHLHRKEPGGELYAIGAGAVAIEPALEALKSTDSEKVARAAATLSALLDSVDDKQRATIESRLRTAPDSEAVSNLRAAMAPAAPPASPTTSLVLPQLRLAPPMAHFDRVQVPGRTEDSAPERKGPADMPSAPDAVEPSTPEPPGDALPVPAAAPEPTVADDAPPKAAEPAAAVDRPVSGTANPEDSAPAAAPSPPPSQEDADE